MKKIVIELFRFLLKWIVPVIIFVVAILVSFAITITFMWDPDYQLYNIEDGIIPFVLSFWILLFIAYGITVNWVKMLKNNNLIR